MGSGASPVCDQLQQTPREPGDPGGSQATVGTWASRGLDGHRRGRGAAGDGMSVAGGTPNFKGLPAPRGQRGQCAIGGSVRELGVRSGDISHVSTRTRVPGRAGRRVSCFSRSPAADVSARSQASEPPSRGHSGCRWCLEAPGWRARLGPTLPRRSRPRPLSALRTGFLPGDWTGTCLLRSLGEMRGACPKCRARPSASWDSRALCSPGKAAQGDAPSLPPDHSACPPFPSQQALPSSSRSSVLRKGMQRQGAREPEGAAAWPRGPCGVPPTCFPQRGLHGWEWQPCPQAGRSALPPEHLGMASACSRR
ncbi:collagen alpha-1(I) chain-like [Suricata suricatta]|uniref:collagen alpha-1(I) chain-like n=1 Tax=Suricata suricatta TaxID=37032 RepID=UPI0011553786|nr:collagen alpha-1(I) chain-like [Suricata suricatta]